MIFLVARVRNTKQLLSEPVQISQGLRLILMAYSRVSVKPCHYVFLTLTLMIFLVARVRITIQVFNEPVQISQGLGLLLMAYSRVSV